MSSIERRISLLIFMCQLNEWTREELEVEDTRSIAEMSLRAVNEASKVIAEAAQEGAVQGRLSEKRVS
jgi:hypothetical protein